MSVKKKLSSPVGKRGNSISDSKVIKNKLDEMLAIYKRAFRVELEKEDANGTHFPRFGGTLKDMEDVRDEIFRQL